MPPWRRSTGQVATVSVHGDETNGQSPRLGMLPFWML
jgi:hypothetical protein